MKVIFKNKELAQLYDLQISNKFSNNIIRWFVKIVNYMENLFVIKDIQNINSLHFKKLKKYKNWQYSVRINKQYRIIFNISKDWEITIIEITELSKHYE